MPKRSIFLGIYPTGGPNAEIDLESRTPPAFDLGEEHMEGRSDVLAKTECLLRMSAPSSKNKS